MNEKCELCNTLEDEFHFLLECPLYHNFRKSVIDKQYWTHPNMIKCIALLTSSYASQQYIYIKVLN